MQFLIQLIIGGLMVGAIYALIGMGFSLIYRSSGLLTFAQGEYFMLGAFVGYTFFAILDLPYPIALAGVIVVMTGVGFLSERLLIGPLLRRGSSPIHIVLATIGLAIFLQNAAMMIWGSEGFHMPSVMGEMPVNIGGVYILPQNVAIVAIMLGLMVALHFFMNKSKLGTALRAAAQDKLAAGTLGINVPLAVGLTWGIAVGLAGIAGMLIAPIYGVNAHMGLLVGLKGFAAAVVGGYGSIYGAVLGGLLVGLVETLSSGYIDSSMKDVIVFAFLLLVLFLKPTGLVPNVMLED
ncbi:branched-chain amino acid ABC transporter permease (plasmid) [Rhizobium sp. RCAM05350]|uniref:branched-chain amino acid ABC transporter permease n=1 Tax=Rhizobium sp. RCAM05350 TaxID=2895568 RepID=UPI002076AE67|nr:branched-chain amino acid ABC transporter permease [Rhizobium sp. RCAM05350]URK89448.1 branched-chain amino acid ABC transporter permease [Rhizobium sp. RCAM05350]